jgi:CHAD domain-containing protein
MMIFPPDESTCIFGAGVLSRHLNALKKEIPGVRQSEDIECIHRMRVASRRLRNAFDLFGDCFSQKKTTAWIKQVQIITQALGEARDTDVQIDHIYEIYENIDIKKYKAGIARLLLRLRQRRENLQSNVLKALDNLDQLKLIEDIQIAIQSLGTQTNQSGEYSLRLYQRAFFATSQHLDNLLSYEVYINMPERIEELHRMRICAKKLRYALEAYSPLYPDQMDSPVQTARKTQDALGKLHDCDVWLAYLPTFLESERRRTMKYYGHSAPLNFLLPGLAYFEEEEKNLRTNVYNQFVQDWNQWKEQKIWGNLRRAISLPVLPQNLIPQ